MFDLFQPLDDDELDDLQDFLLSRVGPDENIGHRDEGILTISELDGLFTAVVSGPVPVKPAQWLSEMWGDFEPEWEEREFDDIFMLLTRHMNNIAAMLRTAPEEFEPMFSEFRVDGEFHIGADEWCEGYMRGVAMTLDEWQAGGEEIMTLLTTIALFGTHAGFAEIEKMEESEIDAARNTIAPSIRRIYTLWLQQRGTESGSPGLGDIPLEFEPFEIEEPPAGRNDPCPCGSGRKYKKCCLH